MYLYQSNRLETLCEALYQILAGPLADPLQPERIVVQNPGMARWLSQQVAEQTGIAAHLHFPLPATFIWDIFSSTLGELPDLSLFDRDVLLFRILSALDQLVHEPAMAEISVYLHNDHDDSKRLQLAGKITDLFDQYLVYRPDMLLKWEQGMEHHWQAVLWRSLTDTASTHRAALLKRFIEAGKKEHLQTENLPERVCLFGINALAPSYLQVIAAISEFTQVHIFHLSPCRQAWDDILPERLLAMKRQSWRNRGLDDISEYFFTGNPLLASMGSMGQEFFSLLMELNPEEVALYEKPDPDSLLHRIQGDILDLYDGAQNQIPFAPEDSSILFHNCHSPMREVQVLHDRLLDLFAADPELKPKDILIMAPDINTYAPLVSGVFGSAREHLRIPWSIADQSGRIEQPVLDAFLSLLELMSSRFTAPEVVALLENRAVLQKFDLQEEDLPALRAAVQQAGIRWGLDQQQRRQQGLDDSDLHTWVFGLHRLLLGYLTGPLDTAVAGVLPAGTMLNDTGTWLGGLAAFLGQIQQMYRLLHSKHDPASWSKILLQIVDGFFDNTDFSPDLDGIRLLREKILGFAENCARAEFADPVGLAVIRRYFREQLAQPIGGQAFLSGKVTFCNMVPMRSVPFKVVWLLGMNDMDYPRSQRPPAFDLIAAKPRLGDRSRRDDDRYLFLEALLSARSRISISWVGRDQHSNTDQPPSVVVAELRDYIDRVWQAGPEIKCSDLLTINYPLQPFSRHCFDGNAKTVTYAEVWLPRGANNTEQTFIREPLPGLAAAGQHIEVEQLLRFWNHPVRYFLEQRLGLRLRLEQELLAEAETFSIDHLQQYLLTGEIISDLQTKKDPAFSLHRMQAGGDLPRGEFGHILYEKMQETATALELTLEPLIQRPMEPVEVDLQVGGVRLTGWLNQLFACGRVQYRPTTCKAKDLLRLWINHLLLLLLQPEGVAPVSTHVATDTTVSISDVVAPEKELERLLEYFQLGQTIPLHFYPKTSQAWAKAKSKAAAMNKARNAWYSGYRHPGEEDDPAYTLALRGHDPLDTQFEEAAALFFPILEHMEESDAAP